MSENNRSIGLNELVDYQKKTYSPFMDKVMRFLWKCAGADAQILQYSPYSDHIKNAGIGGVVLATSVMAALAMGFAMHTIFGSQWLVTLPVALVWGLIIFNLDRFIVSTVKGDGTEKITLQEFWSMLPRLFMAVLIGLTISAPLETYIFETEIEREWRTVSDKMAQSQQYTIELEFANQVREVNLKINRVDSSLSKAEAAFLKYTDDINELTTGTGKYAGNPCSVGENCPRHRKNYESLNEAVNTRSKLRKTKDSLDKVLAKVEVLKNTKISESQDSIKHQRAGFLDKIMMLEKLSAHGKEAEKINAITRQVEQVLDRESGKMIAKKEEIYGSAFWPIWLVRLLFMIVEIAPVIFKFMIWKSSYDYMQDNVAQILEAKQGISLECITDENNNMHKIRENYNARRIVEVAKRQNELEKENAIHAITVYAERERKEIDRDPDQFVRSNDKT